jgi:DNA-binding GntR family transcriptional regulator
VADDGGERKWRRILEWIAADIRAGRYPIGSRIPSPPALVSLAADEVGGRVDRNTIRRATNHLRDVGVLTSRPGAGMYVAAVPPEVLPEPAQVSPLERRVNARIDALEQRVAYLEAQQPPVE